MIDRLSENIARQALDRGKTVVILGARQVGKSTTSDNLIADARKAVVFNGDDADVRTMFANTNETQLRAYIGKADMVLFDEAHKIENIGNTLKIISDRMKDVKLIATGSSSFKLTREVNESLAGRKREIKMYPLSFREMVEHTSLLDEMRMINHRMVFGYYPEVVVNPGDEQQILKEIIDSYLYKDIFSEEDIAKPDHLVKLVQALAFQIGSIAVAGNLANLVGIDAKTVEKYMQILERNFIIFRLPSYARNLGNELKFAKKVYFYDMGIRNAVIGNMAPIERRSVEEVGHMWENFVVSERIKRNYYAGRTFVQNYFWRTQQKKEIDLIEVEDGIVTSFEIKHKSGKTVKVPTQFAAAYPDASFRCITPEDLYDFLM